MAYIEWPATWGGNAAAVHSGLGIDLLRGNCADLIGYSPAAVASQVNNGTTTGQQTSSTAYNDASILWRFPFTMIRGRQAFFVRQLRFNIWAYTSANTGTIEAIVSPSWHVPESPVVPPDISKSTAVGAVTAVAAWHQIEFTVLRQEQCVEQILGAPPEGADRGGLAYYTVYVTIRAKMEAAGTLTAERYLQGEV